MDELTSLRREIAKLSPTKTQRRYPAELRERLCALVASRPAKDVGDLARSLGMAPQTLSRFAAPGEPGLRPVRIVDDAPPALTSLMVRGPCGVVVEGLDVAGVAALLRALS